MLGLGSAGRWRIVNVLPALALPATGYRPPPLGFDAGYTICVEHTSSYASWPPSTPRSTLDGRQIRARMARCRHTIRYCSGSNGKLRERHHLRGASAVLVAPLSQCAWLHCLLVPKLSLAEVAINLYLQLWPQ